MRPNFVAFSQRSASGAPFTTFAAPFWFGPQGPEWPGRSHSSADRTCASPLSRPLTPETPNSPTDDSGPDNAGLENVSAAGHPASTEGAGPAGATGAPSSERFLKETGLAAQVAALIEPAVVDLGFRLVRVSLSGREGKTLQIMAERPDGTINVDDCEAISKQVSPLLDVDDMIDGAYRLEVSSPGIDRPLVRPSDFEDWAGYEARVELREPVDGRRRFKGILEGFEDGEVRIECDVEGAGRQILGLPVALVSDAKLILTDELIREALTRAKKGAAGRPGDGIELDGDEFVEAGDDTNEDAKEH